MRRRSRLLAPIIAAILLVAGCGGADKPAKVASKADFVKAGDKICVDRDRSSAKFLRSLGKDAQIAQLSSGLADIYADAIAKLQAVPLPPGAARAGAKAYVRAVAAQSKPVSRMKQAAQDLRKAVDAKNLDAVKKTSLQLQIHVNTVQGLGDAADQQARDYGFTRCGSQASVAPIS